MGEASPQFKAIMVEFITEIIMVEIVVDIVEVAATTGL